MFQIEQIIKPLIAEKKITIEVLAAKSDITKQSLHTIFNKNDAKVSQLEKIFSALGVILLMDVVRENGVSVVQRGVTKSIINFGSNSNVSNLHVKGDNNQFIPSSEDYKILKIQFEALQKLVESKEREIESKEREIVSKDYIIQLLQHKK